MNKEYNIESNMVIRNHSRRMNKICKRVTGLNLITGTVIRETIFTVDELDIAIERFREAIDNKDKIEIVGIYCLAHHSFDISKDAEACAISINGGLLSKHEKSRISTVGDKWKLNATDDDKSILYTLYRDTLDRLEALGTGSSGKMNYTLTPSQLLKCTEYLTKYIKNRGDLLYEVTKLKLTYSEDITFNDFYFNEIIERHIKDTAVLNNTTMVNESDIIKVVNDKGEEVEYDKVVFGWTENNTTVDTRKMVVLWEDLVLDLKGVIKSTGIVTNVLYDKFASSFNDKDLMYLKECDILIKDYNVNKTELVKSVTGITLIPDVIVNGLKFSDIEIDNIIENFNSTALLFASNCILCNIHYTSTDCKECPIYLESGEVCDSNSSRYRIADSRWDKLSSNNDKADMKELGEVFIEELKELRRKHYVNMAICDY